jgi:Spy/CpxP family protein refolding chaperone
MMARSWLVPVILSLLAGLGGAVAGQRLAAPRPTLSLHDRIHAEITLTPAQEQRLHGLEARFDHDRITRDAAMRAADARLAAAMLREGRYGPGVAAAVDDVHRAMGDLQKASIDHMFAMRAVLTPAQAQQFDRIIATSLTNPPAP